MTKEDAKKILETYHEIDDDTGDHIHYRVLSFVGKHGDAFVFQCIQENMTVDDYDIVPEFAVYEDGTVLSLPL